ncbi:MBL fold metallo-hydrolase [Streptomyces sp. NPDC048279]|uniref:MBL fold metallo-hydrolase n=1 Tax=Streptomyces sp. NPDC048279 TaxID=3154714 RepID=UPI00342C1E03
MNAERLGIDVGGLLGVVLSHGHFDHAGGFDGLARLRGRSGLPLTVHPAVWTRRRLQLPAAQGFEMPTLSRGALEREGFGVDRAAAAVAAGRRGADHRRGGPRHRVRTGHAAGTPGLGRERPAARPRRHRPPGTRRPRARPGACRGHRVRPRRRGRHRPACHEADRRGQTAGPHRRSPPERPCLRAGDRPDGGRAHRTRTRADRVRSLHRLARSAHPRRGPPGRMGAEQRRNHLRTQRPAGGRSLIPAVLRPSPPHMAVSEVLPARWALDALSSGPPRGRRLGCPPPPLPRRAPGP